jgi:uncharacterized protein YigA (DUF484 family)
MSSEVQVGLLVAVATLLAGAVPATVSWLANRETLRHDRLARLRDERKAAYSRFLDAVEELQRVLGQDASHPAFAEALDAAREELGAANSVIRLTADPHVDQAARVAVETYSDSRAEWRQALKESKVRFIIAARRDLGYDASAGSPRATQSLHEPG